MFFVSQTAHDDWAANASGSPIIAADDPEDRLTLFLTPVGHWSDDSYLSGFGVVVCVLRNFSQRLDGA